MSQKYPKKAYKSRVSETERIDDPSQQKGGISKKLLYLADNILRDSVNMSNSKKMEKAEELVQLLKNAQPEEGLQKTLQMLIYGGKGLDPLHSIFKNE